MSIEQTPELVLAPQLVLRLKHSEPARYLADEPEEILGRRGLWVRFEDGVREITYSALCEPEEALAWILEKSRKDDSEVLELRHWQTGELLTWGSYQARQAARSEAMQAELERLLG